MRLGTICTFRGGWHRLHCTHLVQFVRTAYRKEKEKEETNKSILISIMLQPAEQDASPFASMGNSYCKLEKKSFLHPFQLFKGVTLTYLFDLLPK